MTKTSSLISSARKWFRREAGAFLLKWFLEKDPVPAARPRMGKWGAYYPPKYSKFKAEAQTLAEAFENIPTGKPVMVFVETIVKKPKTSKLNHPHADLDNYLKSPWDVMTKAGKFWNDDRQVIGCVTFKRFAEPDEEPGFAIEWFELQEE